MRSIPHVVGMIHLLPLPGSPRYDGSMGAILEAARQDAFVLADAGFPALLMENFGDIPFFANTVPAETVAAMTRVGQVVAAESGLALGVNVLRNDAQSALGVATAIEASFIRVNVLIGVAYTDQGAITGPAAPLLRRRQQLYPGVDIWADVMVKHSVPPPGTTIEQTAKDTVDRGLADVVIVSGSGTGDAPDLEDASRIRGSIPKDVPLAVGSGATAENLSAMSDVADAVIVGSSVKHDGDPRNRVDPARAVRFVKRAKETGLI